MKFYNTLIYMRRRRKKHVFYLCPVGTPKPTIFTAYEGNPPLMPKAIMNKIYFIFFWSFTILVGCSTEGVLKSETVNKTVVDTHVVTNPSSSPIEGMDQVQFMDTTVFDLELSGILQDDVPQAIVIPAGTVTVNQIPERMNKWLVAVQKSDGRVHGQDLDNPARTLLAW
jgi:hypothetical protein